MRKLTYILPLLGVLMLGCKESKLENKYAEDFAARRDSLGLSEFFAIFESEMPADVKTCMEFLYAYMPVPDITDYPGEYFRENVEQALKAKAEMPWGKDVPQREFMHFVLPIRVNNENLDNHRMVFYDELKERVKDLTMEEAILEINHWCHEKATYQPSDSRTHSPLATVSCAIGRCGEESTFTVAALRSVGIPARQVYTPRWAHTDDNHAWVEAWANGKWYFLGACEPEAVLDLGWFNSSAARGMLMTTRAIGNYDGPEEKLKQTPLYTDLNVTANYAPVDTLTVMVVDADGKAIADAKFDFCIYNYAEFYPVASKITDNLGEASIIAGLGDIAVWASTKDGFACEKASVGKDKQIILTLSRDAARNDKQMEIVPPIAREIALPSSDANQENEVRKAYEDSVRMAYTATFVDETRGNRAALDAFLGGLSDSQKALADRVLATLTIKDLTDVEPAVIADAMLAPNGEGDFYDQYVLSPRIEVEFLRPFRENFYQQFDSLQINAFKADPSKWVAWVEDNIDTSLDWQPATVRMSPESVMRYRKTDKKSRNVFFVAGARAIGIPARIDPITEKAQYADQQQHWIDVFVNETNDDETSKGRLLIGYDANGASVKDPGYYTHFTLSKIIENRPSLLNYPEDATFANTFAKGVELDAGEYMLVSGQRMADGTVSANVVFFEIAYGQTTNAELKLQPAEHSLMVIGALNSENAYFDLSADDLKTILSTTGRGYYILGLVSNFNEPSNHAIRDVLAVKDKLAEAGAKVLLLYPSQQDLQSSEFVGRNSDEIVFGCDINGKIKSEIVGSLDVSGAEMPIFVIADTFNRIVYVSQGYTIGLGQKLLDALNAI